MKVKYWVGMVLLCVLIPNCLAFGQRVRLSEGTPVRVRLKADLVSEQVAEGGRVDFEVASPVIIQEMTVIPEGAVAWGTIQSVKKGKFIKFDISAVRLPDLAEVKLRTLKERAKNPEQEEIKVESSFKGGVGAPSGTEYTVYVDESKEVAASEAPGNPAPAAPTPPPVQAATPPPTPAQVAAPSPSSVTPTAPAAPPTSSPTSLVPSAASSANVERIKVECFSDPSAADIKIDGEFYGNTPSILMVPVGKHELEIQLSGYKTYAIPLTLASGSGVRTIRASLEQKE